MLDNRNSFSREETKCYKDLPNFQADSLNTNHATNGKNVRIRER